jgi:hypothetical protein
MSRITITLGLLLVLAASVQAQGAHRGTRPGDSVTVVIHKVRADKRAQYDSLMSSVWWPASQKAGKKYPAYGKYASERRRYVATEMGSDSTFTYMQLYFGSGDLPEAPGGGNRVLRAAGLSKAQSDSFAQAMRSYLASSANYRMVDEPYR